MKIIPTIRFAEKADVKALIGLCELHATYEKAPYDKTGKAMKITTDLFCPDPIVHCLVVESNAALIGYATYMKQYATWDADYYLYMDCLFLKECARGLGIGEKLMRRIAVEARTLGCSSLQWQTPEFNERAIKFYHRLGAISKSKERFFQTL